MFDDMANKHLERTIDNPAFNYLRTASKLNEEISALTEVSLSEQERKQKFGQREAARLSLINQYRKALSLKPIKQKQLKDHYKDLPDGDDHWKRIFQHEAANIMHDMLSWNDHQMAAQTPSIDLKTPTKTN